MTVIVFRHMIGNGLGSLEAVLKENGLAYTYVDTPHADLSSFDPLEPDLLIVMGGSPGVYQAEQFPFLGECLRILKARMEADRPTLGICLGGQLMAGAMGAKVYPGPQGPERGWYPLSVTAEGQDSPVAHLDGGVTSMVQWHGDTFDLPQGAKLLASSAQYKNQGFSWGRNCIGLQCHPEMTPAIMEEWLVSSAGRVATGEIDVQHVRRETAQHGATLMLQTKAFMMDFLTRTGVLKSEQRKHA
jgi:GMP synthase (glutamine-hydrolysing)